MTDAIRVLVVDDDRLVRTSVRRLLERAGFQVESAESGTEALALLERWPADIVLADFMMPGMNGIELLRVVADRWPHASRMLLTAQADKELLDQSLADGLLHGALSKPWQNQDLVAYLLRVRAS